MTATYPSHLLLHVYRFDVSRWVFDGELRSSPQRTSAIRGASKKSYSLFVFSSLSTLLTPSI